MKNWMHGLWTGKILERVIIESIEVALDSFGINLIALVKGNMEADGVQVWKDVLQNPRRLMSVLRDLFGLAGANTIESMIFDNLKSRLAVESAMENDLVCLINEVKHKNSTGRLTQTIFDI